MGTDGSGVHRNRWRRWLWWGIGVGVFILVVGGQLVWRGVGWVHSFSSGMLGLSGIVLLLVLLIAFYAELYTAAFSPHSWMGPKVRRALGVVALIGAFVYVGWLVPKNWIPRGEEGEDVDPSFGTRTSKDISWVWVYLYGGLPIVAAAMGGLALKAASDKEKGARAGAELSEASSGWEAVKELEEHLTRATNPDMPSKERLAAAGAAATVIPRLREEWARRHVR